jgi:hypothetical protein
MISLNKAKERALDVGGEWEEVFPARRPGDASVRVQGSSIVLKSGVQVVRIVVHSKEVGQGEGGVSEPPIPD